MKLLDFTYSLMTGQWRVDRERAREERAFQQKTRSVRDALIANHVARQELYAGAQPGTKRPHPNILSYPDDYRNAYERIVLIRAARQMEEDYPFFDGLLDDFETYVVGDELVWQPNTGNPDADKAIRKYLAWQFESPDYSGRLDLTKMAQIAVRSMKRDGECGFVPVDVGDSIKIHAYPGDVIGNPMIATGFGAYDYNGIVADPASGAPIEFKIYRRGPKISSYVYDRSFSASEFFHYADPYRIVQYHGVSAFKNAIRHGFDIDQILEFTKLNIKWRSSQLPTIHNESGRPRGNQFGYFGYGGAAGSGPTTPTGAPRPLTVDVDGVTTTFMRTDEQVVEYPHDFPNAQVGITIEELRRECCKGVKLPYEFAYRADQGGVVQRFWANKAENTFNKDKRLLRRCLLDPYKNRAIEKGIQTGELDLSPYGDLDVSEERFRGQWRMGRQISVDYGRETDADISLIDAGLMSPQDKVSADGGNLEEVRAEIRSNAIAVLNDAKEIAKETGLPIDQVIPFVVKKWPNPPANQAPLGVSRPNPAESEAKAAAAEMLAERKERERLDAVRSELRNGLPRASEIAAEILRLSPTPAAAAPQNITVNVPERTPVVNLHPQTIELRAPEVRNEIHVPAAAAPSVNVAPAAAPNVVVNVPAQAPPQVVVNVPPVNAKLTIERDLGGRIKGGEIKET